MLKVLIASLGFLTIPVVAQAHAFGQQFTLPLPVSFYIIGGMLAFVASCAILLLFSKPVVRYTEYCKEVVWKGAGVARLLLGLGGIFLLLFSVALGFLGGQDHTQNPLPNLFWILFLVLFVYITAVIGGLWETVDPFRRFVLFVMGDVLGKAPPAWLYYVPGVLFLALLWLELFSPGWGAVPVVLCGVLLFYLLFSTVMSRIVGVRTWFAAGDFFSTFFGLVGKAAPIYLNKKSIFFSLPGERLVREVAPSIGVLFFIFVMLGSTVFDGFRESQAWWDFVYALNLREVTVFYWTEVITLLLIPFILLGLYALAIYGMKALTRSRLTLRELMLRFTYSLIPIAIAYHFAHYFPLVLSQGQAIIPQLSDPFSWGWNLFGTVGYQINLSIVGADNVWYLQLGAIVLGHILAAIVAHRMALRLFKTQREVVLSQLPMLVLMVFYTAFGLWTLSQPFASL